MKKLSISDINISEILTKEERKNIVGGDSSGCYWCGTSEGRFFTCCGLEACANKVLQEESATCTAW